MGTILDAPKDFLQAVEQTLHALLKILIIFKKHPLFAAIVLLCAGFYGFGWWLTYGVPERQIRKFYTAIEDRTDMNGAWTLLDRNYQKVWKDDPYRFESGYKTTIGYSNMHVRPADRAWNPFGFLYLDSFDFDVVFIVEDRFTRDDLNDDLQKRMNRHWLAIAHPYDLDRLEDGTLGYASLTLRRRYRQKITMRRVSFNNWSIANIDTPEQGLVR
jgi:hypothetical protein